MNRIHKVNAGKPDSTEAEEQKKLIREVASDWDIKKVDGVITYTSRADPDQHFTQHDDVILAGAHAARSAETMAKVARFNGWTNVQIDGNDRFYDSAADYLQWNSSVVVDRAVDVKSAAAEFQTTNGEVDNLPKPITFKDIDTSQDRPPSSNQMSPEEAEIYERLATSFEPMEDDSHPSPSTNTGSLSVEKLDDVALRKATNAAQRTTTDNHVQSTKHLDKSMLDDDTKETVEARQIASRNQIEDRYRVAGKNGEKFYKKDQRGITDVLAFVVSDTGTKTSLNDDRVTADIVKYEQEVRGSTSIHLKGNPAFKRQAWKEAAIRNMEVTGYRPSKVEIDMVARIMKIQGIGNEVVSKQVSGEENQRIVNQAITDRVKMRDNVPDVTRNHEKEQQEELAL